VSHGVDLLLPGSGALANASGEVALVIATTHAAGLIGDTHATPAGSLFAFVIQRYFCLCLTHLVEVFVFFLFGDL